MMPQILPMTQEERLGLYAFMRPIWHKTYHFLPVEQVEILLDKYFSPAALAKYAQMGYEYYRITDGILSGALVFEEREEEIYLDKLYLPEEARGRGWAAAAFEFLAQRGKPIALNVNQQNERAIRCYEKNGFTVEREERIPVGGGLWNVDYRMVKRR